MPSKPTVDLRDKKSLQVMVFQLNKEGVDIVAAWRMVRWMSG